MEASTDRAHHPQVICVNDNIKANVKSFEEVVYCIHTSNAGHGLRQINLFKHKQNSVASRSNLYITHLLLCIMAESGNVQSDIQNVCWSSNRIISRHDILTSIHPDSVTLSLSLSVDDYLCCSSVDDSQYGKKNRHGVMNLYRHTLPLAAIFILDILPSRCSLMMAGHLSSDPVRHPHPHPYLTLRVDVS